MGEGAALELSAAAMRTAGALLDFGSVALAAEFLGQLHPRVQFQAAPVAVPDEFGFGFVHRQLAGFRSRRRSTGVGQTAPGLLGCPRPPPVSGYGSYSDYALTFSALITLPLTISMLPFSKTLENDVG